MSRSPDALISQFFHSPSAMTQEQRQELSDWIVRDTNNAQEFIRASVFCCCIRDILIDSDVGRKKLVCTDNSCGSESDLWMFDEEFWQSAAEHEKTAPVIEISPKNGQPDRELILKVEREPIFKKPSKSSLFVLMASAAALLFLIVFPHFAPDRSSYEVATLQDSIGARWDTQHAAMQTGLRFRTGSDAYRLDAGYATIAFDNNTAVTLEGPAQFGILAEDQIALEYGKVYLFVPPQAYGFMLVTPTAKIIDLGTEFGVRQGMDGNTDLHVVKGKTMLATVGPGQPHNALVTAGKAKLLIKDTDQTIDIPLADRLFVRQIDSRTSRVWHGEPLDLADIVGGGNGFGTGNANFGIDYPSGQITGLSVDLLRDRIEITDIAVPASPFIDRLFYPNAKGNPVRLSSKGHPYAGFPKTDGRFWGRIHHGAWTERGTQRESRHRMRLDGITYGTEQNPSIGIHPNQGITFDLDAIRRSLDGLDVVRFESLAGVSETALAYISDPNEHKVDVWVLVDGQERFVKHGQTAGDAPLEISVELQPEDQFLSLAVTDGKDGIGYDWALFGRPRLLVERLPVGDH